MKAERRQPLFLLILQLEGMCPRAVNTVHMASAAFGVQLCPGAGHHWQGTVCVLMAISWRS